MSRMTLALALVLVGSAAGCAPGANRLVDTAAEGGIVAGFGRGVWHGVIAPVTFVVSLFDDDVGIYEAHNIGAWYDVGFLLGLSIVFGGSGRAAWAPRRGDRRGG